MNWIILLAAGESRRFGGKAPKQFLNLNGQEVFTHSLTTLSECQSLDGMVLVVPAGQEEHAKLLAKQYVPHVAVRVVVGGATRMASTSSGLDALEDISSKANVLIHDSARPLVSLQLANRVLEALDHFEMAIPVVESRDTMIMVDAQGTIERMPPRDCLRAVQTPQGFHISILRHAYEMANAMGPCHATDDASVVTRFYPNVKVGLVEGETWNLKITYPQDVAVAEAILRYYN